MGTTERPISRVVAANVRAELARRQLRQSDLGTALGWSQQKVSYLLRAERQWSVDDVHDTAVYLGLDAEVLLREGVAA